MVSNTPDNDKNSYVIKIICGYGHHRSKDKKNADGGHYGLKEAMLDYFNKEFEFDYVYLK